MNQYETSVHNNPFDNGLGSQSGHLMDPTFGSDSSTISIEDTEDIIFGIPHETGVHNNPSDIGLGSQSGHSMDSTETGVHNNYLSDNGLSSQSGHLMDPTEHNSFGTGSIITPFGSTPFNPNQNESTANFISPFNPNQNVDYESNAAQFHNEPTSLGNPTQRYSNELPYLQDQMGDWDHQIAQGAIMNDMLDDESKLDSVQQGTGNISSWESFLYKNNFNGISRIHTPDDIMPTTNQKKTQKDKSQDRMAYLQCKRKNDRTPEDLFRPGGLKFKTSKFPQLKKEKMKAALIFEVEVKGETKWRVVEAESPLNSSGKYGFTVSIPFVGRNPRALITCLIHNSDGTTDLYFEVSEILKEGQFSNGENPIGKKKNQPRKPLTPFCELDLCIQIAATYAELEIGSFPLERVENEEETSEEPSSKRIRSANRVEQNEKENHNPNIQKGRFH